MLAVGGDAPVEAPFQHRQGLGAGQRGEGLDGVHREQRLGAQPAPQAVSGLDGDVEIGEGGAGDQRVMGVEPGEFVGNLADAALQSAVERPGRQADAVSAELRPEVGRGKVADSQEGRRCSIRRAAARASTAALTARRQSSGGASGSSWRTA